MAKEKIKMGKKEKIFNVISFLIIGVLAIYYGGRAVYWFIYELSEAQNRDNTAAHYVINDNEIVDEGDGLYRAKDTYYFAGNPENNYVTLGGATYRILSINENNEMKLVLNDVAASFMWGEENSYSSSNVDVWLGDSGVYYDTLIEAEKYLSKTKFTEDVLSDGSLEVGDKLFEEYVTTLTVSDYETAGGSDSFLNNEKYFWLIGKSNENNLYVNSSGVISEYTTSESYGVKPVITLKGDVIRLRGEGTLSNPIYIDTKDDMTYINSYVTLGTDTYKVFEENEDILKLVKTDSIAGVLKPYGTLNTNFDLSDATSLAYYLNNDYLNSLSYATSLSDCTFNTGVISEEKGFNYSNILEETIVAKVGIMNIFDYNNNDIENYFYLTNTGLGSDTAYVKSENGLLKKDLITSEKEIVPVICLNKDKIIDGVGASYSPYTVE